MTDTCKKCGDVVDLLADELSKAARQIDKLDRKLRIRSQKLGEARDGADFGCWLANEMNEVMLSGTTEDLNSLQADPAQWVLDHIEAYNSGRVSSPRVSNEWQPNVFYEHDDDRPERPDNPATRAFDGGW
jgi:hypothetical protein